ncbi:hypothetical protein ABLB69_11055 [Xenorhabdus khoisanae]|uniref:hypothetical protein n=1 Tax=Xenorhabdus khoisanae TaxID=880157 RepID=UPI0023591B34|nr:hypothetical protein [Xenorhabdus khoisanae]MDC9615452.1 hypothetical protein [Xenorhabdus khoisanae]
MIFREKYKNLYNFIGSWFPDADFEDLTDKEIVLSFKGVSSKQTIEDCLNEIFLLIKEENFPLDEIRKSTNIYFEDKNDCITWLMEIKNNLEV